MPFTGEEFRAITHRDDLDTADMRDLYDVWCAARGTAIAPAASGLRPADLPLRLLPRIIVIGIDPATGAAETRLAGTEVQQASGIDITNARVGPGSPGRRPFFQVIGGRVDWCRKTKQPYFWSGRTAWADKEYLGNQLLGLPYLDEAGEVVRIVYLLDFMVMTPG